MWSSRTLRSIFFCGDNLLRLHLLQWYRNKIFLNFISIFNNIFNIRICWLELQWWYRCSLSNDPSYFGSSVDVEQLIFHSTHCTWLQARLLFPVFVVLHHHVFFKCKYLTWNISLNFYLMVNANQFDFSFTTRVTNPSLVTALCLTPSFNLAISIRLWLQSG